jgi:methyl-accepting chemotaxis protein
VLDAATAKIIEIIGGIGGMAGVLAFLMWFRSSNDAERRQKLLELEAAANRQDAAEARAGYRELVGKVIQVVDNNSRASEAIRITMNDVCVTLSEQSARAIQVAQGIDAVESKVDETLLKVEGMDERLRGLDNHLRSKLP